ncbi:MAG: hypothetical protein AB7S56_07215 [Halothiobacillaceae bacterium]
MSVSVASSNQAALLAELGILQWRARPGRIFPGAGAYAMPHAEVVVEQPIVRPDSNVAQTNIEPLFDVCIYAHTASTAEAELLARIIQAAHGLRGELRIQSLGLDAPQPPAQAHLRLDDVDFPSPASMLAQPSTKRVLWQALQETVGRLS